jgi:hypothetical protein
MRDELAVVNRELREEIDQLKTELSNAISEKEQTQLELQTIRYIP